MGFLVSLLRLTVLSENAENGCTVILQLSKHDDYFSVNHLYDKTNNSVTSCSHFNHFCSPKRDCDFKRDQHP
jgi:hypothetical protein